MTDNLYGKRLYTMVSYPDSEGKGELAEFDEYAFRNDSGKPLTVVIYEYYGGPASPGMTDG